MSKLPEHPENQPSRPDLTESRSANSEQAIASAGVVTKGQLVRDVVLYSVARLLLVVVIGGIIIGGGKLAGTEVPLLVAALFAVLIALPLSLALFAKLRKRVNLGIAAVDAQRRADRDDLRAKLRGDQR
ncbi:DUF4229 domain-containing protein [Rhodococcus sp. IEGM 1379]|uniref:DUF4229 domain-containing protein n=1 Tax=Rhodococcus sp. IEGM 1379 TaxID=3047086 RepID=UPI0024B799A0|nr:DUF4229 domain-containing protein [Rhodococcus sp. IEGM 1379]MDI9917248.1 DUF4229 domain-containing protein [Rhodococcus sp. IEGM 1379]